jgi:shikimate kinase
MRKPAQAKPTHIVLIGLSGSGKSTVGALIAARLHRPFVDTDVLVERAAGSAIATIFADWGESVFRDLEHKAVLEAIAGPPGVIATGGGAPTELRNQEPLWRGNLVVWLDAPVDVLAQRVGAAAPGRPLLAAGQPKDRLAALRRAREAAYAQAHYRLDTSQLSPAEAAEHVVRAMDF